MSAKGKVISTLLIIDTFFVSYAAGFNSQHVLMVDPNLPAYIAKPEPVPSIDADKQVAKKPDTKPSDTSANKAAGKPTDKSTDKSPVSTVKGNHAGAGASKHPSDAKKETKVSSTSVHKPAHPAQKATPKETD